MEKQSFLAIASSRAMDREYDVIPDTTEIVRGLSSLLVSTRALCQQSLYCHWLALEPEFLNLHSLFEQHYQSLRKAGDILSSRIRELGYSLPAQVSQPIWGTHDHDARPPEELIGSLIRKHQICSSEAKRLMNLADRTGDDTTATLACQRYHSHEKAALLLLSVLQNQRSLFVP